MNTKRILAVLLALAMIFSLAACTSGNEPAPAPADDGGEEAGTGPDGPTLQNRSTARCIPAR